MKTEPREVWVQRVKRLADSGLTAKEFASEIGVNHHTLAGWKWRLTRDAVERPSPPSTRPKFVDVTEAVGRAEARRAPAADAAPVREAFEVVLPSGTRIRIPTAFEPGALRLLLTALEAR